MGRTLFARHVGIKERTLISIEREGKKPGTEILSAIANHYPQYIVWLLTGNTDEKAGHFKPDVKENAEENTASTTKRSKKN